MGIYIIDGNFLRGCSMYDINNKTKLKNLEGQGFYPNGGGGLNSL